MPSSRFLSAALALSTLILAGCGTVENLVTRKKPEPCPGGVIVRELSRVTAFRPGEGRDITDVMYEARLPRITVGCTYTAQGAEVETNVTITAARGPANRDRRAGISYFVAVLNAKNEILAKREFQSDLQFPPNVDRGSTTDQLVQRIPLPKGKTAADYVIVVGFQLSPEQLAFNRKSGHAGLLGPTPPATEVPRVDTGGIDNRPISDQARDPHGDRPK